VSYREGAALRPRGSLCFAEERWREKYCHNEGCEVMGHIKDFKVCPQCKWTRYCGEACQKHDWTTGGHKAKCGTFATR